jgi:chromosome segregation ATPase
LTENTEGTDDLDLEIAERLIELTKFIEKNSALIEEIKSELLQEDPTIKKWNDKLEDWELALEKRFEEINKEILTTTDEIKNFAPEFDELKETISSQGSLISSLEETINDQAQQISSLEETINNHAQQISEFKQIQNTHEATISSHSQSLESHDTEINARVLETQFETALTESVEGLVEKIMLLKETQESIKTSIKGQEEKTQTQIDGIATALDIIGKGLEQLDSMSKRHTSALEEQRGSLAQFKHKLKELISLTKDDQKTHFENFSRLLESYNENIRTEMSLIAQSMKKSDIEILNEVANHYTRKKVGENLKQKISDLAKELELEATKTREELVLGLEKTVKEYETVMEEQTTRIKKQQQELEHFQDEIQAVIDRKVNEKYELVFSLLSKVAMHAEELALFMKTAEIQIPEPVTDIDTEISEEEPEVEEEPIIEFIPSNDVDNEMDNSDSSNNSDE